MFVCVCVFFFIINFNIINVKVHFTYVHQHLQNQNKYMQYTVEIIHFTLQSRYFILKKKNGRECNKI